MLSDSFFPLENVSFIRSKIGTLSYTVHYIQFNQLECSRYLFFFLTKIELHVPVLDVVVILEMGNVT